MIKRMPGDCGAIGVTVPLQHVATPELIENLLLPLREAVQALRAVL